MKKLYLVKRKTPVDYDEYDRCVIIADSEEEVNDMIDNRTEWFTNYWDTGKEDRSITEIDLNTCKSMEICSSFNAG